MLHISIQLKFKKKSDNFKTYKRNLYTFRVKYTRKSIFDREYKKEKNYIIYRNKYWRVVRYSLWQYEEMYKYRISLYYKLTRDL